MKSPTVLALLSALAIAVGPISVQADTTAAYARIDDLSNLAVALGICDRGGYRVLKDQVDPIIEAGVGEVLARGLPQSQLEPALQKAVDRDTARFTADREALRTAASNDPAAPGFTDALKAAVDKYTGRVMEQCARAARDPLFGKAVIAPAALGPQDIRDNFVAEFGQASFQPPEALAQGDLLYALGQCLSYLSASDVRLYQGSVFDGPDPADPSKAKLRRWYRGQFQDGVNKPDKLSRADCLEILPHQLANLKAFRL